MRDPALLYRHEADFVWVDLDVLRARLPHEHRGALDGGHVSPVVAAVLWSRSDDSHEQRVFFHEALVSGEGFEVERLDPAHVTLRWLQEVGAVVRWYVEDGRPHLRISATDDDERVFTVKGEVLGDGVRALTDAAWQLRADLTAQGVRRRLRVVRDVEPCDRAEERP